MKKYILPALIVATMFVGGYAIANQCGPNCACVECACVDCGCK